MLFDDHNPPHIHAEYSGGKVSINIKNGVVHGIMAKKVLKFIFEWMEKHETELLDRWELVIKGEPISKIEPLN